MSRFLLIVAVLCCFLLLTGHAVIAQSDPAGEEDLILARVGEKEITSTDIDVFLSRIDPQIAFQLSTPEAMQRIVEELINQSLFLQWALAEQMDQDEEFLQEIEDIKTNLLTQYAIENVLSGITVEEDAIEAYYQENLDRFTAEEKVRASHILVETEVEAEDIIFAIEDGLSFEEAARAYSQCPSGAQQGGDLGPFARGQMVLEFEEAAFGMEIGEMSGPVESRFGYHIIKLTDRQSAGTRPLSEVAGEIRRLLINRQQEARYNEKLEELRTQFEVVIFEE